MTGLLKISNKKAVWQMINKYKKTLEIKWATNKITENCCSKWHTKGTVQLKKVAVNDTLTKGTVQLKNVAVNDTHTKGTVQLHNVAVNDTHTNGTVQLKNVAVNDTHRKGTVQL